MCSGCQTAYYCSRECQRKDWKSHKKMCNNGEDISKIEEEIMVTIK